jgi:hypothetical protein
LALYLTSSSLIKSIKRRGQIPSSQKTFQDEDFLDLANEEIILSIVPEILDKHEDYLLRTDEVPLVSGKVNYKIPYRAIGGKLYDLAWKDSSGQIHEMTRIPKAHLSDYSNMNFGYSVYAFFVEGDEVNLLTSMNSEGGSLLFMYYMRPNELVDESRVGTITAIDTLTGIIVLDLVPSFFSTNLRFDLLQKNTPHKTLDFDLTATVITSTYIQFNPSDLPPNLMVGDFVANAQECIIPQIPSEMHAMLAQSVLERVLGALGDQNGEALSKVKNQEYEKKLNSLISNRVDSSPKKIINRHGHLRSRNSTRINRR